MIRDGTAVSNSSREDVSSGTTAGAGFRCDCDSSKISNAGDVEEEENKWRNWPLCLLLRSEFVVPPDMAAAAVFTTRSKLISTFRGTVVVVDAALCVFGSCDENGRRAENEFERGIAGFLPDMWSGTLSEQT